MATRSISINLPEDQQDDPGVLATPLTTKFVLAVLRDHGADYDDFAAERVKGWREPVTLGELRDWLGY